MDNGVRFARRVFLLAGIYGLVVLLPQYFLEEVISARSTAPISHPENFYGFIGVALAWQVAFLVIAGDVLRLRPLMIPAFLEKLAFGGAVVVLFAFGRIDAAVLGFGVLDLLIGGFFVAAWVRTRAIA